MEDVGAAINKHDPMKLLAMGAPEDEYEDEARGIATLLPWVCNAQELRALVFEVFYMAFHLDVPGEERGDPEVGTEDDPATTAPVADDLMEVWRSHFPAPCRDS
ncbi:MAG: hypothetical protein JSV19_03505 [Phycisphaerales bacterium]|nr:MAG: hypothetical protein JSV19_03505 [Phycisphaerales bacterium]